MLVDDSQLQLARTRLKVIKEKTAKIITASSIEDMSETWHEILDGQNVFFNNIGNAMNSPSEQGWFQKENHRRRKDSLMGYLLHARNAYNHGRSVITYSSSGIAIGLGDGVTVVKSLSISGGKLKNLHAVGAPGSIAFTPARARPLPVHDTGVDYPPPIEYMGSLHYMALKASEYMQEVLTAAEKKFGS